MMIDIINIWTLSSHFKWLINDTKFQSQRNTTTVLFYLDVALRRS